MPYALKYRVDLEWVGFGVGGAGNPPSAQKRTYVQSTANSLASQNPLGGPIVPGSGTANALAAADITSLLASLTTDISAQMNADLPNTSLWISGGN